MRRLRKPLRRAVRRFFRFTHQRASDGALWCSSVSVWMKFETFRHWALFDPDLDLLNYLGALDGADVGNRASRTVVEAELAQYWRRALAHLPLREGPRWLSLP